MDLMDFEGEGLYFDEAVSEDVTALIEKAAENYGHSDAEFYLMRAYFLAPNSLQVLVALYRYYYYQHRLEDTLVVALRALEISGRRLQMPDDWRRLNEAYLGNAVIQSIGLLRFYLLALKGPAICCFVSRESRREWRCCRKLFPLIPVTILAPQGC